MSANREQLVQEFFANFAILKRQSTMAFCSIVGKAGLSLSQSELLYLIKRHQPLNLKELAKIMQLTPGAVTQLVENLVQAGYVTRLNDPTDRRVQLLSLSEKGHAKVAELKKYNRQRAIQIAEILSDKELEDMYIVQKKIINYFYDSQDDEKNKVEPLEEETK